MTTWIGVQHLGYVEFGVAGRLSIDGAFRRLLNSHISIESLEQSLTAASTPEDCWNVLRCAFRECGFCRIQVELAGRSFRENAETQPLHSWKVTVPISEFSSIELYRGFGAAQQHQVVASLVEVLRRVLAPKCAVFERTSRPSFERRIGCKRQIERADTD